MIYIIIGAVVLFIGLIGAVAFIDGFEKGLKGEEIAPKRKKIQVKQGRIKHLDDIGIKYDSFHPNNITTNFMFSDDD